MQLGEKQTCTHLKSFAVVKGSEFWVKNIIKTSVAWRKNNVKIPDQIATFLLKFFDELFIKVHSLEKKIAKKIKHRQN